MKLSDKQKYVIDKLRKGAMLYKEYGGSKRFLIDYHDGSLPIYFDGRMINGLYQKGILSKEAYQIYGLTSLGKKIEL